MTRKLDASDEDISLRRRFRSPAMTICVLKSANCSSSVVNSSKNACVTVDEPGRYTARSVRGPCEDETEAARTSKVTGEDERGILRRRSASRCMMARPPPMVSSDPILGWSRDEEVGGTERRKATSVGCRCRDSVMTRISRLDAMTVSATARYLFPSEWMFQVANRMPPLAKERTVLVAGEKKNGQAAWSGPETPIVECRMGAIVQV